MKNVVIYARYSSHGQTEQSIEGQLRDCHAYAEREGLLVVGEYIDRALTGRNDDRPDFQRMLFDASKKQFSQILVWKLDRFSRNRYDSAMNKAKLKKHGVRVVSATENISDEPEGIMLEGMLESLAEYYSANLSKHVKRGQRESVIKGTYLGSVPPIGFKIENQRLVADEKTAPIIRYAFEQYAAGTSKKQIIQNLNEQGVRNQRGKPLTLSFLQCAFHNQKYIGKYIYNGQEVAGGCEALISEEIYNAVQNRLESVRHTPASSKAKQEYLLHGKAFCGYCGSNFVGECGKSRTGKIHNYYACAQKKKLHTCKKKNEKKDYLEWFVVGHTIEYVLTSHRIEYIASRIVERYNEEFSDQRVVEMERKLYQIEKEISSAVDASLEAPARLRPHYYEKLEVLETQKADVELNIASLKIANGHRFSKDQIITWLKQFCSGDSFDEAFQRRIIDVFINSIFVYDNKIVIYYNIKGCKQITYLEMLDSTQEPPDCDDSVRISNGTPSHNKTRERFARGVYGSFIIILIKVGNVLSKVARLSRQINSKR